MYYMVMAMTKNQNEPEFTGVYQGGVPQFRQAPQALVWHVAGIFEADDAEAACRAAAKKRQVFGSFFAVEGFPWGIDLMETEAREFGVDEEPMSHLKQLETRTREMEKRVGID